ncbi:MAG: hypothetical protein BWX88_00365 [Planctomycetes bacterium ADurb.Bin126]|nr:MAG: hypothetical protein BWX88_00365 [Planctomycetes bacterium ADurb.Bin126]HOD81260.1 hypothetical protein [Phycisphaerae bacterium]HQL71588.1 hypothetical protein [Phycisphaerae bacterium]
MTRYACVVAALACSAACLAAGQPTEKPSAGAVLAYYRLTEGQSIYDRYYHFLGDGPATLVIDVKPQKGHVLQLLWGSKNDERTATLRINGQTIELVAGGYKAFRWLDVIVPDKAAAGGKYEIALSGPPRFGRAAFIAEFRLVDPAAATSAPAETKTPAAKIVAKFERGRMEPAGPAFPEMQAIWDRTPTPPAQPLKPPALEAAFRRAERHARSANEQFFRCRRFVDGWLARAGQTGLIPRNLHNSKDLWNGRDSAADNWSFMVLTCFLTDRAMFEGRMAQMLQTERKLTARVDRLCDDVSITTGKFVRNPLNLDATIFDSAEYVKDGLVPLTEWMGPSPWSERMIELVDDIWKNATIDTPHGKIPTRNVEVNGDLLQACARIYWMTGQAKYLDWAIRLGDYYLLGGNHPTRDFADLRLSDHGCEIVSGLCELYTALHFARPDKKKAYQQAVHEMLDRILEAGVDANGMMWISFKPKTGEHHRSICDTWGYTYDAIYSVYLIDRKESYRQATRKALAALPQYAAHNWGNMDGHADSVEGAINLHNREPMESTARWIDAEIKDVWRSQRSDGVIEGWHGDGNAARTGTMYALWKTQGLTVQPWRQDVRFGAVVDASEPALPARSAVPGGATILHVSLTADQDWSGRLVFDKPRHRLHLKLPIDYPRINQFPEWFVAQADKSYTLLDRSSGQTRTLTGRQLQAGVEVQLQAGRELRLTVTAEGN